MSAILVTGANKGIGLAVCRAILKEQPKYTVLLGSRNASNADAAIKELSSELGDDASKRLQPITIDVSNQDSVEAAAKKIEVCNAPEC